MKNKKRAISEMLSYVILISMAIALSIGVFVWLKSASNISPAVDCNEATSVILENSSCDGISLILNMKNNGRFNLSGILVSVGNDTNRLPVTYLLPQGGDAGTEGYYFFIPELKPAENRVIRFSNLIEGYTGKNVTFRYIKNIQIQPFVYMNKKRIFCTNSVIKQTIPDCEINSAA